MLNILWPIFIIVSFCYAIFTGKAQEVNSAIFSSAAEAVTLSCSLLSMICLWSGIMKIASETKLLKHLTRIIRPIMKILFPDIDSDDPAFEQISANIVANILGLGNAATPIGLKAMKELQRKNGNKDTLSNSMVIFIVLNTASMQLIPTTVIAIRTSLASSNPTAVILPIWIASMTAMLARNYCYQIIYKG